MSVLKSLKSLFIIEEEPKALKKEPTPAQEKVTVSESKTGEPGRVNQAFMDILFKAMQDNNIEGFDYLEYKKSLQSLQKMPMDEPTRYQSAFAMAKTMGAEPAKLIETAEHYLQVLQKEHEKFARAVARQEDEAIDAKGQQINDLQSSIKTKEQQIQQLQAEIAAERKRIENLQTEIGEARTKVETTKNNFIASYNALVSQIAADVERMKQYLK